MKIRFHFSNRNVTIIKKLESGMFAIEDESGGNMDNRRKLMIALLIIGVPLFIWIQFVEVPNKVKIGEAKMQQDPETHDYEQVIKYESPYMGDASNLMNLLNELPLNEYKGTLELDSDALYLDVNYDMDTAGNRRQAEQAVIYNTTAVFALIENLQQMTMHFNDQSFTVSRDHVEKWFGTTLVDFKDPKVFKEKVQSKLKEDLSPWLIAYTESE